MPISKKRDGSRAPKLTRAGLAMLVMLSGGCGPWRKWAQEPGPHDTRTSYHDRLGMQITYPEVAECANEVTQAAEVVVPPLVDEDPSKLPVYELTLAEAVQMAVRQSPVIRDLGGTVVTAPSAVTTVYEPSLAHTNPGIGVEAALSAYDAQYSGQLFWNKLDQPNNVISDPNAQFFAPSVFQGTTANYRNELFKRTAQGGRFALRQATIYDRNNRPSRVFASDFNGWVEAEWRQPLMRGAGTQFNRIVGTPILPGQYNGILIARVNEDVALADFEASVIRLVNDVEQAYWDLSAAYRVLEASLRGRESALQTFQYQEVRLKVGAGRSDEEAQAQSQFYQFQATVERALSGETGLYALEQRLRYLLGLPAADGRLIKPVTPPSDTRVVFDWESALSQALQRRVEIRRQRFNLKRRELELYAAQMNRRPQLDFLGNYRVRGLGNHLFGTNDAPLNNLMSEFYSFDYQEWQAGMEMTFPIGLRAASNAVAHARLNLNRERAVLSETELRISHNLADAVRRIGLAHSLLETNYNGLNADIRQVDVLRRRYRDGTDNINFLLQAQRQVTTSEIDFYRSLSAYNLAIRDLHREKGSLLAYNGVTLAEGPWVSDAYSDAYEIGRFLETRDDPSGVYRPEPLSSGPFDPATPQNTQGVGLPVEGTPATQPSELLQTPPAEPSSASDTPRGTGPSTTANPSRSGSETIPTPQGEPAPKEEAKPKGEASTGNGNRFGTGFPGSGIFGWAKKE